MPYLGKPMPEIDAELRMLRCSYHYAFYIAEPAAIQFIAFLHERMDVARHLSQRLPTTPH